MTEFKQFLYLKVIEYSELSKTFRLQIPINGLFKYLKKIFNHRSTIFKQSKRQRKKNSKIELNSSNFD